MLSALVLLALAQAPTPAGEPMTLEQALALADSSQVDVKLADLALSQVEQDEVGSYASILPRADFNASVSKTYVTSSAIQTIVVNGTPQTLPPESGFADTSWAAQIAVNQNILDGAKWWTRIAKGHVDREAAEAQLAEARLQAHLSVAHLFYELVRAARSLEILQVNARRSQEQVERAEALFEAGRGPKSDVYAAQVNLANDEISVAQQRAKLDLARNSLNIALGREAELAVDPKPPDLAVRPAKVAPSDADPKALTARPGLAQLRKQVDSAEKSATIARGDYYPALSASLAYQRGPAAFGTVVNNPGADFIATGGLNLTWNIFEGRATSVAVQKAEIASDQARAQLVKSERSVLEETERGVRNLDMGLESLDLAEKAHRAADLGMQLAQERFRAGAASNLEVRDAQLKLTSAELTLVSTQIDVHLSDIDVRAAQGQF